MVNYEEAKKIALESLGEMAIHINEAFETEDAYIFNDSKPILIEILSLYLSLSTDNVWT